MKIITLGLFGFLFSISAAFADENPPVIQRYTVIGASVDGKKLAVMVTYFGPSSGAPFANLYVYQADSSTPFFTDGSWMMSGGEAELASLASSTFERNKSSLLKLGINFESPTLGDANYVITPSTKAGEISGQMEIESVGTKSFQIESTISDICPSVADSKIDIQLDNKLISISPDKTENCIAGAIQLRTIIRTKTAVWFIVLKKLEVLGIPAYLINVAGIAW
jgi:hypothetical protein